MIEALTVYPNKRIFAHFIQPHYPFIGELGQQLETHAGLEYTYREAKEGTGDRDNPTIWDLLWNGTVSTEKAWNAYAENLELVIKEVENLLPKLTGKTVVTSDHGNLFGDRLLPIPQRAYGHPKELYAESLVKVPWLTINSDVRRDITTEPPLESENPEIDTNDVTERLSDLGYR